MSAAEFLARMTAVGVLLVLYFIGSIVWKVSIVPRRNRKWILQQPSASDADFLNDCGLKENSEYAKLALAIRQTLAEMYDLPREKLTSELRSGQFIGLRTYNGCDREEYFEKIAQKIEYPDFSEEDTFDIAFPDEFLKEDIPVKEFVFSFIKVYARYHCSTVSRDISNAETEAKK